MAAGGGNKKAGAAARRIEYSLPQSKPTVLPAPSSEGAKDRRCGARKAAVDAGEVFLYNYVDKV